MLRNRYKEQQQHMVNNLFTSGSVDIKIKIQLMMIWNWKHNLMWMLTNMQATFNLPKGNFDH
jgi:hypothetical protein